MKRFVVSIITTLGLLTSSYAVSPAEKNYQDLKAMGKQANKTTKEDTKQVLEVYNSLDEPGKILFRKVLVDSMAQKINQSVPAKIDNYTTLTKVVPGDNGVAIFHYQITADAVKIAESGDTVKSFMKKLHTLTTCNKPETKIFFDMGITISYNYSSVEKELFSFSVTKEDCLKPAQK